MNDRNRNPQPEEEPMHRSNRYRIQTRLDQAIQNIVENRRSHVSFAFRLPNRFNTMSYFACDSCHITFGTTWLDHCPCCGSHYLSPHDNLALANKEMN